MITDQAKSEIYEIYANKRAREIEEEKKSGDIIIIEISINHHSSIFL